MLIGLVGTHTTTPSPNHYCSRGRHVMKPTAAALLWATISSALSRGSTGLQIPLRGQKTTSLTCTDQPVTLRACFRTARDAALSAALIVIVAAGSPCFASDGVPFVRGTVSLQPGTEATRTAGALYVTARPDRPDNVPGAILSGTRGKPPPVASARYTSPISFPFDFELGDADLTAEGAAVIEGSSSSARWWSGEDLVVSARFDSDGVAATRDPGDLVGRGFSSGQPAERIQVRLQGRGVGGRLITSKAK